MSSSPADSWTLFVDDPPHPDLLAALAVLRRPRKAGEVPPFEEPDVHPLFRSINVLHCRRLPGPTEYTWHLVVGADKAHGGLSSATVFAEADDQLTLCFGPADATEVTRGGMVTGALGGLVVQLVPDGIASVGLEFPHDVSTRVEVVENLWWHRRARGLSPFPSRVSWLGQDGQVVRSFD